MMPLGDANADPSERLPAVRESVDVRKIGKASTVATYKLGGRDYPLKTVASCIVCTSHHRVEIERQAIKGHGWAGIARQLPEEANISARNIAEHVRNGHLPMDLVRRNAIFEESARSVGRGLVEAEFNIIDQIAYSKLVINRRVEYLMDNDIVPDATEAAAAARLLAQVEIEKAESGIDEAAMLDGFLVYAEAIREHTTPDQFAAIARTISSHPVMRRLLGRAPRGAIEVESQTSGEADAHNLEGGFDGND